MTLKPTQFRFQVTANNGVSAQAIITIDGAQLWSGSLAHTVTDDNVGQWTNDDTPYSTAACEINTPEVQNNSPQKLNNLFTISVTGGDIILVGINQTNNPTWEEQTNPEWNPPTQRVYIGGNPNFEDNWDVVTQPLWDGQVFLNRYTLSNNLGITGPGSILVKAGETCEFTGQLWQYCPVIL
jgi:hypothetical protein